MTFVYVIQTHLGGIDLAFKLNAIAAGLVLSVAATPAFAATDLIGQSINAAFSSGVGNANLVQFASPQTVGGGVEFTGSFTDVFDQNWSLALDFNATGFTLGISDDGAPNGNVQSGGDALTINITNLSGIGALTFLSYSCSPAGVFPCTSLTAVPTSIP